MDSNPSSTKTKPSTHDPGFTAVPEELRDLRRWVCWKWHYRDGKWTKVPINPHNGHRARTDDHRTWGSFDTALRRYEAKDDIAGVGFVFTEEDPYIGADYDDCVEAGKLHPQVAEDLAALDGYAEISPSGNGVKTIVRGRKPGERCSTKGTPWSGKFEMYDRERFFAITGDALDGHYVVSEAQDTIEEIYRRYFPQEAQQAPQPKPTRGGGLEDRVLIRKARNSRSGALFRKLFDQGDISGYGSHSEGDFDLLRILCFWCALDAVQMKRLFTRSKLHRPEAKGEDYVGRSIAACVEKYRGAVYDPEGGRDRAKQLVQAGMWAPLFAEEWSGMPGGTDHDVFAGLLIEATEKGIPRKDGRINITPGTDNLAKKCGTTQKTVIASLRRLKERGLIEILPKTRARSRKVIVLRADTRDYSTNIHTAGGYISAVDLCEFAELLRLRWGQAHSALTSRVGKVAGLFLHWMMVFPQGLSTDVLAECVHRRRDAVVRYLHRLEEAGLVVRDGDLWRLAPQFAPRLDEELENSGSKTAERLQEQKAQRRDEALDHWRSQPPVEAPEPEPDSTNSLEELEVPRNLIEPDGFIEELELSSIVEEVFSKARAWFSEKERV